MQVCEIMTRKVETVAPDASLQQAAQTMEAIGIGSLPVCDCRRLVGIVSLGDIATEPRAADLREVGEAIAEISEPSRPQK